MAWTVHLNALHFDRLLHQGDGFQVMVIRPTVSISDSAPHSFADQPGSRLISECCKADDIKDFTRRPAIPCGRFSLHSIFDSKGLQQLPN